MLINEETAKQIIDAKDRIIHLVKNYVEGAILLEDLENNITSTICELAETFGMKES